MNPYHYWLSIFWCSSYQELYSRLVIIARHKMGLDGVSFPLSALEHPPENKICPENESFIWLCYKAASNDNSDADAIKLIKYLKDNPPVESYDNPELSDTKCTQDEVNLMKHIFSYGIDLPGSKHNLYGHLQYFSEFFIDMFFGNYTEFMEHVNKLSKEELQKAMRKREGYNHFSPIFAPILGTRLVVAERLEIFTKREIQEIMTMYSLNNENEHLKIMEKLIELGSDVNAHDIFALTPLHYAVHYSWNDDMVEVLLQYGANPNSENRNGWSPLFIMKNTASVSEMRIIDMLMDHNAKLVNKEDISLLRTSVETHGTKELALRVREAHPRDKEECEKCGKPATKLCSACKLLYYCTPACQKLDWKFHKSICKKKKKDE